MRIILAIQCFFAVLFGSSVPAKALPGPVQDPEELEKLKKDVEAAQGKASAAEAKASKAEDDAAASKKRVGELEGELKAAKAEAAQVGSLERQLEEAKAEAEQSKTRLDEVKGEQTQATDKLKSARDDGALALLAWLQREGRLIDFLMEEIDGYEDEEIGAAVRAIHKGCRKVLSEGLAPTAILPGEEEERVEVKAGFDPVAIQLTGNVKGDPPFKGTLMHHGWRASKVAVPVPETVDTTVLAAAEVEL